MVRSLQRLLQLILEPSAASPALEKGTRMTKIFPVYTKDNEPLFGAGPETVTTDVVPTRAETTARHG